MGQAPSVAFSTSSPRYGGLIKTKGLDRLGDKAATGEERASRKRRLIKGPKEFRGIREK
jgi:hypothetical protein